MHQRGRAGGLVLWALIPWVMGAAHGLSEQHTTISPAWDALFTHAPLHRRGESECPQNYSLCPASLNGDCCPSDRSCGTSSCYATTAAPQSACASAGYVACGLEQGGGCCPGGYSCGSSGCLLVSSSSSEACSSGSFFCPGALGDGCCRDGLGCGNGYCYPTTYPTVTVTREILTTDSNLNVITVTTVIATAYAPAAVPTLQTTAVGSSSIARFTPTETAVAKVAATSTPSSGGGLSTGALAGIICAAVLILIAIVVASFFIIRRLNAVAEQSKGSQTAGSNRTSRASNNRGNGPPSAPPGTYASTPLTSHSPNMSANPLLPISPGAGALYPPGPSPMHSIADAQELPVPTPPPTAAPEAALAQYAWPLATPHQSPLHQHPASPPPAAASETQYFDTRHHSRQNSEDFYAQYPAQPWPPSAAAAAAQQAQQAQSPSPPRTSSDLRDQNLRFGRPSLQSEHARHWSSASSSAQLPNLAEVPPHHDGGGGAEFGPPTSAAAAAAAAAAPPPGPATAARPANDRRASAPPAERRSRGWSFDFLGAQRRRRSGGVVASASASAGEGQRLQGVVEFPNQAERNSLAGVAEVARVPDVVVEPVEKE